MPPFTGVYRNPGRWRAVIDQREIRHSTAGCLLSVVLFAPLFVRTYGVSAVAFVVLVYASVVVPAVAGYYNLTGLIARLIQNGSPASRSPIRGGFSNSIYGSTEAFTLQILAWITFILRSITSLFLALFHVTRHNISSSVITLLQVSLLPVLCLPHCLVHCCLPLLHGAYIQARAFRVTVNQLVFFLLLERALVAEFKLQALCHLLCYNVLVYVGRNLFGSPRRRPVVPHYLAGTGWIMAARLGKAVVLSTLLSVTGYHYVHMDAFYTLTTACYFLLTQYQWTGDELIVKWLKSFHFLEVDEEELWLPTLINGLPVLASISLIFTIIYPIILLLIPTVTMLRNDVIDDSSNINTVRMSRSSFSGSYFKENHPPKDNNYFGNKLIEHFVTVINKTLLIIYDYLCLYRTKLESFVFHFCDRWILNNDASISHPTLTGGDHTSRPRNSESQLKISSAVAAAQVWPPLLLCGLALYTNVVTPVLLMHGDYLLHCSKHGQVLRRFSRASKQDCIRQGTCAVCLEDLSNGRSTSCGHVYHAQCLRSLLHTDNTRCPLCNTPL